MSQNGSCCGDLPDDLPSCNSPSPDGFFELDDDLRTFEEKYKIIESIILGEGCSSVVKECILRSNSPKKALDSQIESKSKNSFVLKPAKYNSENFSGNEGLRLKVVKCDDREKEQKDHLIDQKLEENG